MVVIRPLVGVGAVGEETVEQQAFLRQFVEVRQMSPGAPRAPTECPAMLSIRITTTFLIGRVLSAGGV